ncbi:hypothetical protein [Tuberibacillus sp. Marseille-P3662]|uniref:hypothetical protein n=1 Tax=Tuberibacillus sp. Marseille-P3662 TaxID=1965358 RepID=UPI000A1CF240|nr:hypothetical protein [Tuberibacillus sp. Marseille-P3662]
MYIFLIVLAILVCVVGLVGTIFVGKEVNQTIEKYDEEGDTHQDEQQRSWDYETRSLKNVKVLSMIYGVTFLGAIIALIIFI